MPAFVAVREPGGRGGGGVGGVVLDETQEIQEGAFAEDVEKEGGGGEIVLVEEGAQGQLGGRERIPVVPTGERPLGEHLDVLRATELVLIEVSLFEFVPGAPQFHDVVSWMHDHGFVVADLFDAHNRLLDGALARMDVAFVQEDGRFRQSHSFGTRDRLETLYANWGF